MDDVNSAKAAAFGRKPEIWQRGKHNSRPSDCRRMSAHGSLALMHLHIDRSDANLDWIVGVILVALLL
jgi:hypothetical protein